MYRVFFEILIILINIFKTVFKSKNDIIIENLCVIGYNLAYRGQLVKVIEEASGCG